MDSDGDVERLFSWLQTPDLHYREFAGEREVSDATAAWPALRNAAATSASASAPASGSAQPKPPADAPDASRSPAPAAPEGPVEPQFARSPLAARFRAAMGRLSPLAEDRSRFTDLGADAPEPIPLPRQPERFTAEPQRETRPSAVDVRMPERPGVRADRPEQPERTAPSPLAAVPTPLRPSPRPTPHHPVATGQPAGLFGGAYRGFDDMPDEPAAEPAPGDPGEHPRSLDAVFSRLARPTRPHREVRNRAAGQSGLGPVFRRLR